VDTAVRALHAAFQLHEGMIDREEVFD